MNNLVNPGLLTFLNSLLTVRVWPGTLSDCRQVRTPCKTPAAHYWGIEWLLLVSFRKKKKIKSES